MSTAILFSANTTPQNVAVGNNVNFGTPVRGYGKNLYMSGGNVVASGVGYYTGIARVDFVGAAGTTTLTVKENGMPIPGAAAAITTEAATAYNITIPFVVRNKCCVEKTITVEVTGAALSAATSSIIIEKA